MIFESKNWRVTRRIGIGDSEHVRNHLLSIGCFHSRHLLFTVEACYKAAVELGMMPRVHINAAREHPVVIEQIVRLVHRFMQYDAQLMEHGNLSLSAFDEMFNSCDLLIEPLGQPNHNIDDFIDELVNLLKLAWQSSGGRFLGGNFARLTQDELKLQYPKFFPDSSTLYEAFTYANLT